MSLSERMTNFLPGSEWPMPVIKHRSLSKGPSSRKKTYLQFVGKVVELTVGSLLQNQTVVVQHLFRFAVQFDEVVKHRGLKCTGIGRVRLGDARNFIRDLHRLILM